MTSGADVVAGIDAGGSSTKWVLLDPGKEPSRTGVRAGHRPDLVEALASVAGELVSEGAVAVGVGVAGLVTWPEGRFVWGPHLPSGSQPLRRCLERRLGVPVVVDNDANVAALAELRRGAARGWRHVLVVLLGAGIGAGLIMDGRVYRGGSFAGEVGHVVLDPSGPVCACGKRGCWETLVSGSRLDAVAGRMAAADRSGAIASAAGSGKPLGRHLVAAAEAGDGASRAALQEAGWWLGRGIAQLVTVLDPERVVVGGAAAEAGEWLLAPARQAIASAVHGAGRRRPVEVVQGTLGAHAGALGAALLAAEAETWTKR